jgi:hypothetical protein
MPIGVTAAYAPTRFEGADGEASNGKLDQSKAEATRIADYLLVTFASVTRMAECRSAS